MAVISQAPHCSVIDGTGHGYVVIETVEMHTGGQPLRLVVKGYPEIRGETILDKRQYVKDNYDFIRRMLMLEPRGSDAMYGIILIEKDIAEADIAALFMHGEGYSTMCGDAVISLGRYAIDYGVIPNPTSPITTINIQCPCGLVKADVEYCNGQSGAVSFNSVPSFVEALDQTVQVPGMTGLVTYDLVYGGAYYAMVDAASVGIDLSSTPIEQCTEIAGSITDELRKTLSISHPENSDLGFLFGTIFTTNEESLVKELCYYAERQVDRSPCGSGTTAKVVLDFVKGRIKLGEERKYINGKVGSVFVAKPVKQEIWYGKQAVVVNVKGKGHYMGESKYWLEEGDELGKGFMLQ